MSEDSKTAVNSVKAFFRQRHSAFFWHNGDSDTLCSFHGLHILEVVHSSSKLVEQYRYRMMKKHLIGMGLSVN